jgi:rRNA-processing protein FCF1
MIFGFSNNSNVFEVAAREFPACRMLVSKGIVNELDAMSKNMGKKGVYARIALMELKAKKIDIDNINEADHWILDRARRHRNSVVITNDTVLARKLSGSGIKVLKLSKSGMLRAA